MNVKLLKPWRTHPYDIVYYPMFVAKVVSKLYESHKNESTPTLTGSYAWPTSTEPLVKTDFY